MTASIDLLLARLIGVRAKRAGGWLARCPAHDDLHPSLSVDLSQDGIVLLHCFAQGCAVADITAAVGLTVADLFTNGHRDRLRNPSRPKHRFTASDVIDVMGYELLVAVAVLTDFENGVPVSKSDMERVRQARDRINRLAEVVR